MQIVSTQKANWIWIYKSPNIRIVKSKRVVVQPGIPVQILPLEPQVLLQLWFVVAFTGMHLPLVQRGHLPIFGYR